MSESIGFVPSVSSAGSSSGGSDPTVTRTSVEKAGDRQGRPLEQAVRAIENKVQAGDPASRNEVQGAINQINEAVQLVRTDLEFSVDDDTGRAVVKVLESRSDEVIRQIPAEEILTIAENIEEMRGILFDDQA
ncbi:flagellar protein FlaG [Aquisalimonas asiatica]|uniref:Flagellar protein FlaG n=1 Tax=Aquisalimonas asiatica TaxID=406100 RepID=A0A1H8QTF3_9GAMM|nr:flagellar protein FlaG [Aquisalimonas asiatica]SEO57472.1 flagellar protein FlaG [Aquisalimonas asiatica]